MTTERSKRFDFSEMIPPMDWRLVPLGEVVSARSCNSKLIKGKQYVEPGNGRFPGYSASGQDIFCDAFEHEGEAVIISAVGARCGKCFLANGRWSAVANTHILFPKQGSIDTKYLWYLVNNEEFWVKSGTAQPFVKVRKTLELPIPVPPLDQQKRIVAEIEKQFSRLDEAVANLKRVKANLKRYKASVLKAAVEGRLVETEAEPARREGRSFETGAQLLQRILDTRRSQWKGKGKYKEPAAPDTTDLPELPEGWVWATVEQISHRVTYGLTIRPKYVDKGVPVISAREIGDGSVNLEIAKMISEEDFGGLRDKCKIYENDVLFSKTGTIGRVALVKFGVQLASSQNIAVISPLLNPMFLELSLRSPRIQDLAAKNVKTTAVPDLQLRIISSFPIAVPPKGEQNAIVDELERRLSLVREAGAQVDANLKRAERLRQSILAKSFSCHD